MYFSLKSSYITYLHQFLSTLRTSNLLIKGVKIYQFKKLKVIQEALCMAFVILISNLKSSCWFKIYSRKTFKNGLKKHFLRILRVKIFIIQKTIGHLGRSFSDLPDNGYIIISLHVFYPQIIVFLVFIYITNVTFVDKEGKYWSILKNPKCFGKLFLWPFRW